MKEEYIKKIYAGWLAKIIGIRLGAPIESWTYEKIEQTYGEIDGYLVDYKEFAADDDSNGPLFFLRALEDAAGKKNLGKQKKISADITAQDIAQALLNYAPFEHGFFWWGGYGVSTEHTAYLNLYHGISAPRSGSIFQNGKVTAEQIGGQIFIDTWGLVAPGQPYLAAKMAKEAASVTHDGNGVYGGMFVAACISSAFEEKDILKIIDVGLSVIPGDCEYAQTVKAVRTFWEKHPYSWRSCFQYIYENFGYDRYPGVCHIIPNTAVMILALLYGNGNFSDTLNICNMCGWDTDCNVGNVATIMGVYCGLDGIDMQKWRVPVHDFLICSSVIGSLNIMDIPYGASYIAYLAYQLTEKEIPQPWKDIWEMRMDSCHFEYPGSTHSLRMKVYNPDNGEISKREGFLINSNKTAYSGERSLKFICKPLREGEKIFLYKKTYYRPENFHDSRYDPAFSPLIYPGQTLHCAVNIMLGTKVCLYVHGANTGKIYCGEWMTFEDRQEERKKTLSVSSKEMWQELVWRIPKIEGELLDEAGVCILVPKKSDGDEFYGYLDDLYWDGQAEYTVDFGCERTEVWPGLHREISQFTRWKGNAFLEENKLHISCSDLGEMYSGGWNWTDYCVKADVVPVTGKIHLLQARVQGAMRSYAVALLPDETIGILKNNNGYKTLCRSDFAWKIGETYQLSIRVSDNQIIAGVDEKEILVFTDTECPYLYGSFGIGVQNGSHLICKKIYVNSIK